MENQLQNLTKRINTLYVLVIVLCILSAGSVLYLLLEKPENDVLKARGIVLTDENGTEGLSLALFEDGTTGLIMNSPKNKIFIGKADSASILNGEEVPFFGIKVQSDSTFLLNGKKSTTNNPIK